METVSQWPANRPSSQLPNWIILISICYCTICFSFWHVQFVFSFILPAFCHIQQNDREKNKKPRPKQYFAQLHHKNPMKMHLIRIHEHLAYINQTKKLFHIFISTHNSSEFIQDRTYDLLSTVGIFIFYSSSVLASYSDITLVYRIYFIIQ